MALIAGLLAPGLAHVPAAFGSAAAAASRFEDDHGSREDKGANRPSTRDNPGSANARGDDARGDDARGDDARGDDARGDDARRDAVQGDDAERDATRVPCDPNALIVAILRANADGRGNLSLAEHCTYTLTAAAPAPNGPVGLPVVTSVLAIHGNGSTILRAANAPTFRFFEVAAGAELRLDHLTLTGGFENSGAGGGAIYNSGEVTVSHGTFTNNRSPFGGGAIRSFDAVLNVRDSLFAENEAIGDLLLSSGGAISTGGVVIIERTKFLRNVTAQVGGAIDYGGPQLRITDSVVADNEAESGGGIDARGVVTIVDTTIRDNRANQFGGGIFFDEFETVAIIRDSRIDGNTAQTGGGVRSDGQLSVETTKVTGNLATATGGGISNTSGLTLRDSEITGNRANSASAGLVVAAGASADLFNTKVTGNSSTGQPGGIFVAATGVVTLDPRSVVINNRPTNCVGSPVPVTGCFG